MRIPWDALRAAADTLLYTCLEADQAPGFGGQVIYTGAPGPSTGFTWPADLLVTMGRLGLVIEDSSAPGRGNVSRSQPINMSPDVFLGSDVTS